MKSDPVVGFGELVVKATRQVTYTVTLNIDGTDVNIDPHVKQIRIKRTAGNAKIASFTAALATEVDVTLFPSDLYLGANPLRKRLKIWVGFEGSEVKMFDGVVQSVTRRAITDLSVVALDDALALSRVNVETPAIFNSNSNMLMKEILENAGVSSRAGSPSELIFALDFDGDSRRAVVSAKTESADVDDNGVNLSTIEPHRYYDFDSKRYYFVPSTRSRMCVIESMTPTYYTENTNAQIGLTIDPTRVLTADNAGSKSYVPVPSGYGGGAVINPSVVYFAAGWNGAKYWMAVTPRPKNTFTETEKNMWRWNGYTRALSEALVYGDKGDPVVVFGDNGTSWSAPGFTNPIYPRPTYSQNTTVHRYDAEHRRYVHYTMTAGSPKLGCANCDATLVYDSGNNRLYCIWRLIAGSTEYWYYRYTTNGTSWSTTTRWRSAGIGVISNPVFVAVGSRFRMWWVNKTTNPNRVYTATCDSIGGTIHNTQQCTITTSVHRDVLRVAPILDPSGTGYVACVTLCNRGTNFRNSYLLLASSPDGRVWRFGSRQAVVRSTLGWDNYAIISGCLRENQDSLTGQILDLWYTAQNNNGTDGLGKTTLFQDLVAWEGVTASRANKGPIIWGPFYANKMVDGRTDARYTKLWPQSNADNVEHVVTFGGWFSRRGTWNNTTKQWVNTGITWSDSSKYLLMEVQFGNRNKFMLCKNGASLVANWQQWTTGTSWSSGATVSKGMSTRWGQDEEHYISCSIRMIWRAGIANPDVALTINVDGVLTDGSWTQNTAYGNELRKSGLTQVCINSPSLKSYFDANCDATTPGLSFDNLFVKWCGAKRDYTPLSAAYQLEKGLNKIRAGAYRGSNPWEELKLIAEAELGAFFYDESGVLHFYNRQHYNLGTAAQSVMTINSTQHLKDLVTSQDVGDIRNVVRVRVKSQDLGIARDIWKLDDPLIIPALKTVTTEFETSGVLAACDTLASVAINYGGTRYRASYVLGITGEGPVTAKNGVDDSLGGAESYIRIEVLPNGRGGVLNITNSSTRDIVLYDGNGTPYLYIWGKVYHEERFSMADSPVIEVVDVNSVAAFGANEYEVNLDYMTDPAVAASLGQYLVMRYGTAPLKLEDVKTVGDPRLDIGDKVAVVYSYLGINSEFWIESITDLIGPETGYEQDITVAIADDADWFILDSSLLGSNANPAHQLMY